MKFGVKRVEQNLEQKVIKNWSCQRLKLFELKGIGSQGLKLEESCWKLKLEIGNDCSWWLFIEVDGYY